MLERAICLSSPMKILISPGNTLIEKHPEIMFNLGAPLPRHTKLIIASVLAAEVYKAVFGAGMNAT